MLNRLTPLGKRTSWGAGIFILLLVPGFFLAQKHSILLDLSDPQFKPSAAGYDFAGQPYSGIGYAKHSNQKLGRLSFFWQGMPIWKDFRWYSNGSRWAEYDYNFHGQPNGKWRTWHPDGHPKSLTHYVLGKKDGEQWAWHSNGTLIEYNRHDQDETITHKSWIFDGTPFYNYVSQEGQRVGLKGGDFCRPARLKAP